MKNALIFLTLAALMSCAQPNPESGEPATEASKETGIIEMTSEAQSHIGLQTVPARVQQLTEYLPVTGTVQPIDSKVSHVRPLAAGRLTTVLAKVGDRVSANQTLALFDNVEAGEVSAQYQTAGAELARLNVQLAVARQNTERNRQLAELGAIPRKDYELSEGEEKSIAASIEAQQGVRAGLVSKLRRFGLYDDPLSNANALAIRAPFAGVIIAADAAPGEGIGPESELFRIADLSQVWVQGEVYEKDLGRIQVGQIASIMVDTYPNREFLGRVTYISDVLDPETRTAKVRCELDNSQRLLKLEMFATVRLPTTFSKDALAIPAEAVQQIDGSNVVFIRNTETTFEQKPVQIGRTIRGLAEVLAGLEGGEAVVTKGAFHLKSVVMGAEIGEKE